MYTESRNNFSLRNVILQFLFIALLVFILIWLFPTKKDMKKATKPSGNDTQNVTINNSDLSILYDRIFNENIMTMKEAAQSYYTTERLPQKVGDSVKMTLREMLAKKIVLPFKDKNGKQCDLDASYVKITKKENEFVMKVNLKCGEEENYLLTYMGCYDYCSQTICEKKGYVGKIYKVTKTTTPKTTKKYYCKIVNGKYYNNNGKVVSKADYEKACTAKKYYCKIVNGKYYNNNGKVVSKADYEKACTTKKYYCKIVNGKYYDNNGNVVNKEAYEKACTAKKYYCKIVNGKYYDKNGNIVDKEKYEDDCIEKYTYIYRYVKTIEGTIKWSDWTEWSETYKAASDTVEVQKKTTKYRKLKGYNVKTENDLSKPIIETKDVVVGSTSVTSCASYNVTSTVTGYTEKYIGKFKYSVAPKETAAYTYRLVKDYNWYCEGNCTAGTVLVYDKYQKVPQTSTSYSCAKYNTEKTVYVTKQKVVTGYEKKTVKEPVYEYYNKITYRYRTKTTTPGSTVYKWSHYNDTTLLNAGYTYTGEYRVEKVTK